MRALFAPLCANRECVPDAQRGVCMCMCSPSPVATHPPSPFAMCTGWGVCKMATCNQGGTKPGRVRTLVGGGCVPPPSCPPLCRTGGCANGGGVQNGGPRQCANQAGGLCTNTRGWVAPHSTKDAVGEWERLGAHAIGGAHPSPCPSHAHWGDMTGAMRTGRPPPALCTPIPFLHPKA